MGGRRKELGALAVAQIDRRGMNFVAGLGINVTAPLKAPPLSYGFAPIAEATAFVLSCG